MAAYLTPRLSGNCTFPPEVSAGARYLYRSLPNARSSLEVFARVKATMHPERRAHERARVQASFVLLMDGQCFGPYAARDLSAGGAMLEGRPPLEVGDGVEAAGRAVARRGGARGCRCRARLRVLGCACVPGRRARCRGHHPDAGAGGAGGRPRGDCADRGRLSPGSAGARARASPTRPRDPGGGHCRGRARVAERAEPFFGGVRGPGPGRGVWLRPAPPISR